MFEMFLLTATCTEISQNMLVSLFCFKMHTNNVSFFSEAHKSYSNILIELRPTPGLI